MRAYYTDEERSFFWRRRDDKNEDDDPDSEMAEQADVDTIYKYANRIEDYYKGKIGPPRTRTAVHGPSTRSYGRRTNISLIFVHHGRIWTADGHIDLSQVRPWRPGSDHGVWSSN